MDPRSLREKLDKLGMSQRELARKLGVTDRAVRYWIEGKNRIPAWLKSWLEMYEKLNPPPAD